MAHEPVGVEFTPCELPDDVLLGIGRLIRATAEIEDIISVHLCDVSSITEGLLVAFMGRTSAAQKLKFAEQFAKATHPHAAAAHKACFGESYDRIIRCRNAVAHGLLLGQDARGNYAFRTASISEMETEFLTVKAVAYSGEAIIGAANAAEQIIPQMDEILRVKDKRQERLAQYRGHPPKALSRAKRAEARQLQRQSSRPSPRKA